jgi:hypothetical protein
VRTHCLNGGGVLLFPGQHLGIAVISPIHSTLFPAYPAWASVSQVKASGSVSAAMGLAVTGAGLAVTGGLSVLDSGLSLSASSFVLNSGTGATTGVTLDVASTHDDFSGDVLLAKVPDSANGGAYALRLATGGADVLTVPVTGPVVLQAVDVATEVTTTGVTSVAGDVQVGVCTWPPPRALVLGDTSAFRRWGRW